MLIDGLSNSMTRVRARTLDKDDRQALIEDIPCGHIGLPVG